MLAFHSYADIFPLIEGAEFAELVADVAANDLREKIVVWQDAILDGRNRYRAARSAGLIDDDDGPERSRYFQRFLPEVDGDPLKFVISKNLARRHLDDRQRASVAAKIANLSRGGDRSKPPIGGLTTEKAAATLNVAPRQVERARVVHEHGAFELRQALDRGQIGVSAAEKIARLSPQEQQAEIARKVPANFRATMASRLEPPDSLDFFPTPPWGTRALVEKILPALGVEPADYSRVWEPACGEGHMAEVLAEYFQEVIATDIFDYGYGKVADFFEQDDLCEWIITNPPFGKKATDFTERALSHADNVAMFLQLRYLEGLDRYERVFASRPPTLCAFFAERIPLHRGRWEPDGDTATAFCWLVWINGMPPQPPFWIPPGQRQTLTRDDDRERFTAKPVIKKNHEPAASAPAAVRSAKDREPAHAAANLGAGTPFREDDDLGHDLEGLRAAIDVPQFLVMRA